MDVKIKRIYEPAEAADGVRVLVDRLWPRGVKKADAAIDLWAKEVTPSAELRKAWHADPEGHEPSHFAAFAESYREELASPAASAAVDHLISLAKQSPRVTLLYGARNEQSNHAMVLRDEVLRRAR
ncbi:MAG: DUF488 family protein [Actinobacteria bacterium]|jgi:uncharacterized protein YeaO (DUF488 family)|nr:DUF488 family protein [Actinomycetota bacterium]